jgi:hypothetical protein
MPSAAALPALWLSLISLLGLLACERQETWTVTCAAPEEPLMTATLPSSAPLSIPAIDLNPPAGTETATFALG